MATGPPGAQYGHSRIVVGSPTPQFALVTDWEELWERAEAIIARCTTIHLTKVKAHTTDEALASKEQQ
eukprot:11934326-Karenia_brevis.AAC.1